MIQAVCLQTGREKSLPEATATKQTEFMEWVNAHCPACHDHHMMAVKE